MLYADIVFMRVKNSRRCRNRRAVSAIAFGFWLTAATIAAATITSWHTVALPGQQSQDMALSNADHQWHLRHYLSPDCECSRAISRYLVRRGPLNTAIEEVVLVTSGNDALRAGEISARLIRSGFHTRIIASSAAAEARVEAVPTLEIEAPDGRIRFRGGYRDRTAPAGVYLDVSMLSDLIDSKPVAPLPVFGCATSARLRQQLNPLAFYFRKLFHLS